MRTIEIAENPKVVATILRIVERSREPVLIAKDGIGRCIVQHPSKLEKEIAHRLHRRERRRR